MKEQPHLTVNGFMLIDAPHSALNMSDADPTDETMTLVKSIQKGRNHYPYVSAQALRYWWREVLNIECNWTMSPIERKDKNTVFTQARPWQYEDDDVFGYMRAQAEQIIDVDKKTGEPKRDSEGKPVYKKGKNKTLTRNSPLKCSPLVSVTSHSPTRDFSTMSRQDANPVIHQKQFYSTILKGIFSLDLTSLGRFQKSNRTGFQNISEQGIEEVKALGMSVTDSGLAVLPLEKRKQRAKDTISVLPYLSGGANQTLHLTDVTPKVVILTVLKGGNHLFMNIVKEERGEARINMEALREILRAYRDRLQTDVFIGRRSGFLDEQADEVSALTDAGDDYPTVQVGEVNAMIAAFTDQMTDCME